jgi:peptide-methionine (S)-S-oxide reductase
MTTQTKIATLGGGCFWCLEAVFDDLDGVLDVISGYSGGHVPDPDYKSVCTGTTGHAEVIQVTFDPQVISYKEILEVFFSIHDPTTLNRQGNDVGTQYRSVIFYHNPDQKRTAEQVLADLTAKAIWPDPIVTELAPLDTFYPAEDYHQEYFKRNPYQGYCQVVVAPKVSKFRKKFANRLKS